MDIEKAIEWQKAFKKTYNGMPQEVVYACDFTIAALEELQQYRQTGTVDECRAAMEKQTPKKVRFKTKNSVFLPCCPNCGETYCDCSGRENYCKNCGQKWEWGD